MPLLARCWDFLTEGGYTAIVIGSQALSLHLLKLSEREKGRLDWRVAFPSKDLDISVPALEKEGEFNQEFLRDFSDFIRGLEDVAYRGTQMLNLRAEERGLVAQADRLHEVLKPDMVKHLYHNLRRMEGYGIHPWGRDAWRRFLALTGLKPMGHGHDSPV